MSPAALRIASIVAFMLALGSHGVVPDWVYVASVLVTLPIWAWLHRPS